MEIILNNIDSSLSQEEIEDFFYEERVEKFLLKKSKDDPIRFPWDTRAPRVYKYKDYFIKIHGLKRRYHFFTGKRVSHILLENHRIFNKKGIKTVMPLLLGIKGKYSVVITEDITKNKMCLLSEFDYKFIKESTIKIHNDLKKIGFYHGDNKPDNSAVNLETKEIVLLDIDSIEKPNILKPKRKLKRKTEESLKRKIKKLNLKIENDLARR